MSTRENFEEKEARKKFLLISDQIGLLHIYKPCTIEEISEDMDWLSKYLLKAKIQGGVLYHIKMV